MKVPYHYTRISQEEHGATARVLDSDIYYQGPETRGFEEEFAAMCGVRRAVSTNSGSSTLMLILKALGIGQGDEVIVPAAGFLTVAESVVNVGATPVFVDIEDETFNMKADQCEAAITKRSRAVIPIHTYGHPVDMDGLQTIAQKRNVVIIEDCAHAAGARYKGRRVASIGRCGFFSFAGKSMSVCGMGGMMATDDESLANRVMLLRDHGRHRNVGEGWYAFEMVGYNLRLSEIHCAIGRVQVSHLDEWNARRRQNAALYTTLLNEAGVPVRPPVVREWAEHAFLHYTTLVPEGQRDPLRKHLLERGVETGVLYPVPIHLIPPYAQHLGTRPGQFPTSERVCDRILSLPVTPAITADQIHYTVDQIKAFYAGAGRAAGSEAAAKARGGRA
ncbi:MAG: DegT/DnrJ/EryC1/StrS family aminotransferase [Armatimonadetes bacterium]|nr:DegT/DnrJ/EryC1/StrS family aminotransferase [Armatimonadota bacterium]